MKLFHACTLLASTVQKILQVSGRLPNASTPRIVLTSHDLLMRDASSLSRIHWHYLVMDEGHRLKNSACKLASMLKSYTLQHRLLLTGQFLPQCNFFHERNESELQRSKEYASVQADN